MVNRNSVVTEVLDNKTDAELIESLVAEAAKAASELRCATQDINKAHSRLAFSLMILNRLIERKAD